MIKRSHIRQFLAVVEAGSFTHAASRVRVTQPTLSTGVAELERLVGGALFIRDRRQVRLTEAGGRFLPIARELERAFLVADGFGRGGGDDWPNLKLGALRTIPHALLQSFVAALGENFGIELIEGSDSELRAALGSGRIQMALTLVRPGERGAHIFPILTEAYAMLVGTRHRLAGCATVDPEELAAEIMIARRSCELLDATSRFFSQRGVRPRFALRSDSDDRCLHMVAAGLGITTAPLSLATAATVPIGVKDYDFMRTLGVIADTRWAEQPRARTRLAAAIAAAMPGETARTGAVKG